MQQVANAVGATLAVWQIIIFVFANKMLTSMWILVNSTQYFVFIALWQVSYSKLIKVVNKEIRRVSLGEYLNDLEIGKNIADFLNLPIE